MQKSKGYVLLIFVLIIICTSLTLLVTALLNLTSTKQNIPISYPQSESNIIRIIPKDMERFIYATISTDDTIILKDVVGDKRVINLDKKEWHDIQWNPDYTIISVIGQSANGKNNLFIFNLTSQKWEQVSFYSDYDIEQYIWNSNDEILFTQGVKPERWLHSYKYSSKNQIIKINRVEGNLIKANLEKNILVFNENSKFSFRDVNGELIANVSDLPVLKDIKIADIINLQDPSKFVIKDDANKLYIYDLIDEKLSEFSEFTFEPHLMCSFKDNFKIYGIEDDRLIVQVVDIEQLALLEENINLKLNEASKITLENCNVKDFLIKEASRTTRWFNSNMAFPEILVLKNDFDVDVKL